jgi:hypothetical protein
VATWAVDLHALNAGSALLAGISLNGWTFGYVLNSPGAWEADVPLGNSVVTKANFAVGAREIRVKRNGTLVWGGYLWGADPELTGPNPPTVAMRGEGYSSRLRHRFVMASLIYNDVDQKTILRNLIDHTESQTDGDLGIDTTLAGNHTGGNVLRDREYCQPEHPGIYESIDELTQLDDGLDWEIGPAPDLATNKLLKTYQPRKGTDKTATVTITDQEASEISYQEAGDTIVSDMLTIGGGGDCNPAEDHRSDAAALATYGLMQGIESIESDRQIDVDRHGREALRNAKTPRKIFDVTIHEDDLGWGDLVVGDVFTLQSSVGATGGFGDFSIPVRVLSFDVMIEPAGPDNSNVFYRLACDSVTT